MLDTQFATIDALAPLGLDVVDQPRNNQVELLKADDIKISFDRVENEIIPLGNFKIEVVMADVPLSELLLDAENPRIQLRLNLTKDKSDRSQGNLRAMMWDLDEVKKLKKTIEMNGGLIEAIIISGDDGTVFEGNSRVTCIWQLWEEDGKSPDSPWAKVKARILPPGVNRRMIDSLLGELHVKGKNKWVPFEQAAFLYRMNKQGDGTHEWLAQKMGMSKTYIGNKIKAFSLMQNTYIPMLKENGKEVKDDVASQWSWFEEFYKACRPGSKPKKDEPKKIYDDQELEEKFCEWMIKEQLPEAADVRKLAKCLNDEKAVALLDKGQKIDKAFSLIAGRRPELASPLWKDVEKVADLLESIELNEIDALRDKDPGRVRLFERLADAMAKIRKEVTR